MSDTKNTITPEMVKAAQRASGIGFMNQLLSGPPVDDKPMTVGRASGLLKRAHGFLLAREKRVAKVIQTLSAADTV